MPRAPAQLGVAIAVAFVVVLGGVTPLVGHAQTDSGQVFGKPQITVLAPDNEFEPGRTATLELTLTNRGRIDQGGPSEYEELVTTAEGLTLTVRSGGTPIEVNTGTVAVGDVETGTTDVPPIRITIPEDTAPGTYRLPVEYEYEHVRLVSFDENFAEFSDLVRRERATVTIRVRDQARFEVVGVNSTAKLGDTGTLDVTLRNVGTEAARDASVTATSTSDELFFGTDSTKSTAFVGAWAPGEERTVTYKVGLADDAVQRDYTLDVEVAYTDLDGINQSSRTLKVGVFPAAEQAFAVRDVSSSLRVDEEGTLSGTVVNLGPEPVHDPVVTVSTNNPNVEVNSAEYALPDLAPGESGDFEYAIEVSSEAEPSVQRFTLTVEYQNEEGDDRTSDALKTNAEIAPHRDRFVVELVDAGEALPAGGQRSVRIRVTNNGDEPLRDVEAKAFVSSPLSSGDDEAIIAELAPGESDVIVIGLGAGTGALEKTYPVTMDFQYVTPDGDTELSRTYTLAVQVTEPEGSQLPLGGIAVGVAVLGGLAFFGWRRWG